MIAGEDAKYLELFERYRAFTMVPRMEFIANLRLIEEAVNNNDLSGGCIVECGTWKGGMSAAMVDLLGAGWEYHFFDSFQGLPLVTEEDGPEAARWQEEGTDPRYFNNCLARRADFDGAMSLLRTGIGNVHVHEGWFRETLPTLEEFNIAVLRLDADWYASTKLCLEVFWPRILRGGLVIVDDYFCWEGCRRALHEFLANGSAAEAIQTSCPGGVAYLRRL